MIRCFDAMKTDDDRLYLYCTLQKIIQTDYEIHHPNIPANSVK